MLHFPSIRFFVLLAYKTLEVDIFVLHAIENGLQREP